MPKWVPPIPTEQLYSAPAMGLGAGLALLVWCYDGIERDGTVRIDLGVAAGALGRPYRTVKEWWRLLREGPFFSSVRDRGKLGFVVTFDRDWIEWRVLETNYPPTEDEGQPGVFDGVSPEALSPVQGPVKGASSPDEGQPGVFDAPAYKVLSISGEHDDSCAPRKRGGASSKKPKAAKEEKPPTPIEIRQAIADVCAIDLKHAPGKSIIQVNDTAKKLWAMQQERQKTIAQTAQAVAMVADYCRRIVYPYSAGQPLTPAALHTHWDGARQEFTNGQLEAHQPGGGGMVRNGHAPAVLTGDEANAAALARSGQRPDRAPLRRAKVDW